MTVTDDDCRLMSHAIEIAARGAGYVEPNPQVGCVIVQGGEIVGEGWHKQFGGPHAEVHALESAGDNARGATAYASLEPCCHAGKTPPCTEALIAAGIARVVIGCVDPSPQVSGQGIATLQAAGIEVKVGVAQDAAEQLIAPFAKVVTEHRPWITAKWAMTLDGKIASHTGSSQWISGPTSRRVVHELRGRMDAVVVGRATVECDDPLLTARPAGPRVASRVVLDSTASLLADTQLVKTANEAPVIVAAATHAPAANCERLTKAGAEVLRLEGGSERERLMALLAVLCERGMTNLLFEGGSRVIGTLLDMRLIDEVHVFVAPKLVGGFAAVSAVAGQGIADIANALELQSAEVTQLEQDIYIRGRVPPA